MEERTRKKEGQTNVDIFYSHPGAQRPLHMLTAGAHDNLHGDTTVRNKQSGVVQVSFVHHHHRHTVQLSAHDRHRFRQILLHLHGLSQNNEFETCQTHCALSACHKWRPGDHTCPGQCDIDKPRGQLDQFNT